MQNAETRIKSNFWKVNSYRFLSCFWLIAPIMVPFYHSRGMGATQIFIVQAIYSASLIVFEIPSGYLSDVIGRKRTLVLGSMFLPTGLCIYAFSDGFYGFAIAEFILGIAGSMRSGTDSALIYDTLIELGKESQYNKFEGRAVSYERIGGSVASVLGGLFALIALKLPFYINIGSGLIMVALAVTMVEPKRKRLAGEKPLGEMLKIVRYCIAHRQIRTIMILSSLLLSSGVIGVWSYYMYYEEIGLSIGLFGIIFAISGLCSALGSRQAHLIEERIGGRGVLFSILLISPFFILLGLIKSAFLLPFIFLNGFLWGVSGPLLTGYINKLVGSDIRATVLSVSGMCGSLSFVVLSPIFGRLVDVYSLSFAHISLGVFFLIVGLTSLFLLYKNRVI